MSDWYSGPDTEPGAMIERMTSGRIDAFIAGFRASAEGFNGEWGEPSEQRLRLMFEAWSSGAPEPEWCGIEELTETWVTGPCDFAAGHAGPHSWDGKQTRA